MTVRTTVNVVVFKHPFSVEGAPGALPAGEYEIQTDEASIDGVSFLAYRRIGTLISVHELSEVRTYSVEAHDLDAALVMDQVRSAACVPRDSIP